MYLPSPRYYVSCSSEYLTRKQCLLHIIQRTMFYGRPSQLSSAVHGNLSLFQTHNFDSVVDGYKIEYHHILEMGVQNRKYGNRNTDRVSASETWHLVTGLQDNSWYELRVCAYSGSMESRYAGPVLMQTEKLCKYDNPMLFCFTLGIKLLRDRLCSTESFILKKLAPHISFPIS